MSKRAFVPEDLLRVQVPSDPRLSPDGESVVYCVKRVAEKNKYATDLYLWTREGTRRLTAADTNEASPRWRPDGSAIAFTSDRNKPKPGLFLMSLSGGEPTQVAPLPEGSLSKFEWSPNGKHIAVLYRRKAETRTEEAKKARTESGASEPPLIVETLIWRLDGDGVFGDDRYELCVVDVDTGQWRPLVTTAHDGQYSFCWLDSGRLAVSYNPSSNPTMEPWNDDVFVVDLAGKSKKVEGLPIGTKDSLTFLYQNEIALSYADRTEDKFGYKAGRICFLNVDSGEWADPWKGRDELDASVWTLSDTKEPGYGARLYAHENRLFGDLSRNGSTHVCEFLRNGEKIELVSGTGEWSLGSAHKSTLAVTYMAPTKLPEIVVLRDGEPIFESKHNAAISKDVDLIAGEEEWIETDPGTKVQSWVLKPHGFETGKKYPACLEVHGGPHGMYSCCVFLEMQALAGAGYVVCWSNPRGSTGYGEYFARCITGDWGNKDWKDVRAVTDYLKNLDYVDADRVAIMGGSYGGYMVNWAIGHTDAYKCAITDRCVSNLLSKSGNSDYTFVPDGNWPGSAFRGDWEVLWDRSPVKHFADVNTPTLVVHSEGDLRCHIEQGEQVYTFLKMKGVPTRFVRYPANSSHGLSRSGPPDLRVHRLREQLTWYEKYL
jgi:dipeptidyl aminopeptidase/acylaminoacyl peptidase